MAFDSSANQQAARSQALLKRQEAEERQKKKVEAERNRIRGREKRKAIIGAVAKLSKNEDVKGAATLIGALDDAKEERRARRGNKIRGKK